MNTVPAIFLPVSACQAQPPAGQMRSGVCVPFGTHAAPWWSLSHITPANLGWYALGYLATAYILGSRLGWFTGQYEVTRHGFRFTVTRRWYGTRAWVIRRGCKDDDEPERFRVFQVDTGDSDIPWLKVGSIDFATDEAAEPFWAPVTDFYPEAVRKLRPWIFRYRHLRLPALFAYMPVSRPDGA